MAPFLLLFSKFDAVIDVFAYQPIVLGYELIPEQMKLYRNYMVLRTGADSELFFDLTGRTWHIDAGDGDWPCGEVYIAPNETQTRGTVFFDRLFIEDVGEFQNVTLFIEEGMVAHSSNDEVKKYMDSLPAEDKVVCELGLGMNPNVTELCGYTVLDEKMSDSFHIAIGANNMFGGQNKSSRHTDFVHSGCFRLQPVK